MSGRGIPTVQRARRVAAGPAGYIRPAWRERAGSTPRPSTPTIVAVAPGVAEPGDRGVSPWRDRYVAFLTYPTAAHSGRDAETARPMTPSLVPHRLDDQALPSVRPPLQLADAASCALDDPGERHLPAVRGSRCSQSFDPATSICGGGRLANPVTCIS